MQKDVSKAWLDQMVLHASLDLVDESKWQQQQPFLKVRAARRRRSC